MEGERLTLTVAECAEMLGLSKNSTYTLVAENKLPHIRLNGRIIVPRDALNAWLAKSAERASQREDGAIVAR